MLPGRPLSLGEVKRIRSKELLLPAAPRTTDPDEAYSNANLPALQTRGGAFF
jgi:hypothetical protein